MKAQESVPTKGKDGSLNITYRTRKGNLVVDTLSRKPESPNHHNNNEGNNSNEDWEAVSYLVMNTSWVPEDDVNMSNQVFSQEITSIVGRVKISADLWKGIEMVGVAYKGIGDIELIKIQSNLVKLFRHITSDQVTEFQKSDNQISSIYPWVQDNKLPPKLDQNYKKTVLPI